VSYTHTAVRDSTCIELETFTAKTTHQIPSSSSHARTRRNSGFEFFAFYFTLLLYYFDRAAVGLHAHRSHGALYELRPTYTGPRSVKHDQSETTAFVYYNGQLVVGRDDDGGGGGDGAAARVRTCIYIHRRRSPAATCFHHRRSPLGMDESNNLFPPQNCRQPP